MHDNMALGQTFVYRPIGAHGSVHSTSAPVPTIVDRGTISMQVRLLLP